ncbi:MAG: ABC-ATPase domain-containing protein [Lachnospiraceae bacterium]|nr:ABC-ATPase domain-containing protein [Lachnospiraceae bacterium]
MRSQAELKKQLRSIDHKGYKVYKVLEGEYDFGSYRLSIDHVQGDPFATPSRVRILYYNRDNIAPKYFETRPRRIAAEDYLLRRLHRNIKSENGRGSGTDRGYHSENHSGRFDRGKGRENDYEKGSEYWNDFGGKSRVGQGSGNAPSLRSAASRPDHLETLRVGQGSGKSGLVTACRAGQEILERTAMRITPEVIEARIEIGFPAYGRTIAAGELETILFDYLPSVAERTFHMPKALSGSGDAAGGSQMERDLEAVAELADDQQYIRDALDELGLVAFVADGSILPRESGVSQRPMKNSAVAFESPESLAVTLKLPHRGEMRGMGIKKGITVITGGGFHGKSTLLKALERGVYNHIAGDGREFVITDASAFKLRAEEGRCIHETDISLFINNLPTHADTARFSTENASGSTSQAANTVEALCADNHVLLIDEDTSATNFMVRDERMARLVSDEKEPITPFIRKIRSLYDDLGVSTILVVGSSGDYLEVADTVLQMDCYVTRDVTARAKALCRADIREWRLEAAEESAPAGAAETVRRVDWLKKRVRPKQIEKPRVHGWDTLSLDRTEIDLRYLEQIVDESQTAALAYLMQYILKRMADGKKTVPQLAGEAFCKMEKDGVLSVTPPYYGAGPAAAVRRQEILACLARYRML